MNLRFVEAFYWVATFKSMTRAAEKLSLTQGAISSRVAALEQELGVGLIDRRDRHVRLTQTGLRFLGYAERLLSLQRQLRQELGGGERQPAQLRIGAIESVLHTWLIPMIERLRADNPTVELELTVEMTPVLLEQLKRGGLDLVLAAMPTSGEGVRSVALPAMELVFVSGHKESPRRLHTLQQLAERELLTFQRGSLPQVALVDLLRSAQVRPRRLHAVSSISAMVKLLEIGMGVATLPRLVAQDLVRERPGFTILKCATPLPRLPVHLSHRTGPASAVVDDIVRQILSFVGTEPEPVPRRPSRRLMS